MVARTEYIILQSVDLPANRYRIYRIIVDLNPSKGYCSAKCSWGRVGGFGHSKKNLFRKKGELVKFIQALLMKRKRNGYGVVEKSVGFPACKALELLPVATPVGGQMELFGWL